MDGRCELKKIVFPLNCSGYMVHYMWKSQEPGDLTGVCTLWKANVCEKNEDVKMSCSFMYMLIFISFSCKCLWGYAVRHALIIYSGSGDQLPALYVQDKMYCMLGSLV
ncbi:hypothetical protein AMECASPLE_006562 [Ameca splendens]|uniref:Uncharacterized protein n=1 Tax=Ameca splendens TaxID=208324 RepID=A0ABV0ZW22_9TELE